MLTHTQRLFFLVITLQSELAVSFSFFFFFCAAAAEVCMVSGLVRGVHFLVNNEAGAQRENTLPLN